MPHFDGDETSDPISYQVQYLERGRNDWFIMTGRDQGQPFQSGIKEGMHELASEREALDTAEALVRGDVHPHKRTDRVHRYITDARVVTMVRLSKITSTFSASDIEDEKS